MKAAEKSKNGFVRCKFDTSWKQKRYRDSISFPYAEDTGRIFYDTKEKCAKEKIRRKASKIQKKNDVGMCGRDFAYGRLAWREAAKIMTEQGLTLEEYVEG